MYRARLMKATDPVRSESALRQRGRETGRDSEKFRLLRRNRKSSFGVSSLLTEISVKELHRPIPCIRRRFGVICLGSSVVEESVTSIRVNLDVRLLARLLECILKLFYFLRRNP